ncbi:hypothetical protein M9H77_04454 [Catharanthus roseus]|uniref:Uncharacterized protein n=1 Tax=Catharanthus roseus TaxID=4058 RepID=A0ACC0CE54_CATRO|nr:hypothetical protein M9H77_04454 [Catharanthus roseus]
MGSGEQIDDLIESGTIRLLAWKDATIDILLVWFRSGLFGWDENIELLKVRTINGQRNVTITTTIIIVHNSPRKTHALYRFTKTSIEMSSKFISKLISHLVANNPEIHVSNIIQEVQVLFQTGFVANGNDKYFWRDAPYNLTFYPPNMNNQRGREQGTRFSGEIDYRNLNSPPRCSRCRMPRHNRKNCNNSTSNYV